MRLIRERFQEVRVMIVPHLIPMPPIEHIVQAIHQEILAEVNPHEEHQSHIQNVRILQPGSQNDKEACKNGKCLEGGLLRQDQTYKALQIGHQKSYIVRQVQVCGTYTQEALRLPQERRQSEGNRVSGLL
ncbi:hypothetical protein FGO68_gene4517 [Halteria grandinella]|uniref:Uncharacterized protein n=1 Tax=Halteria grandinella TaxID=5974 RepID=A0A8J8NDP1_HALGN|nr:hypothetical protein FGO68_gene4517 [Halteria grandinella]